jgi:hypothetical protein
MTTLLARAHLESVRLGNAVRRYWRRMILGALCGWIGSSVLGAFGIVWLESLGVLGSEAAVATVGAGIVWFGIGLGMIVAYAIRPQPTPQRY